MGGNNLMESQKYVVGVGLCKSDDVMLHQSDNAWRPWNVGKSDAKRSESARFNGAVRSVLNKLTPQNFEGSVCRVVKSFVLNLQSEERLNTVVNMIIESAIDEPQFAVVYANLSKRLMQVRIPVEDPNIHFKKILLNRCQQEFEAGEFLDERESARAKKSCKIQMAEAKRRYLGNIRFIGELFKLRMLTEPIMHDCICKLLSKKTNPQSEEHDGESLECLCCLLFTIGKDLDHGKNKDKMDSYFRKLDRIVKDRSVTPRVRFTLMDLAKLRQNQWISRRGDNAPKRLDLVRRDVEREEQSMSADELFEKKVKNLLDHYISTEDGARVISRIDEEVKRGGNLASVVRAILARVLDRSSSARFLSGRLCSSLIEANLLTPRGFVEAALSIVGHVEVFILDVPHLWNYLGEIFAGLISSSGHSSLKRVAEFCDILEPKCYASKFLAATLKCLENTMGRETLANCWKMEGLCLNTMLGTDEEGGNTFLVSNHLHYLDPARLPRAPLDLNDFSQELEWRLRTDEDDKTQIWIHEEVGEDMLKDYTVIRAIVAAVFSVAITGEGPMAIYESDDLKKHRKLLRHFLRQDVDLQIQAVHALQIFVQSSKHPPSVLQQAFDTCFDGDIISLEAFRSWWDCGDDGASGDKLLVINFFKRLDKVAAKTNIYKKIKNNNDNINNYNNKNAIDQDQDQIIIINNHNNNRNNNRNNNNTTTINKNTILSNDGFINNDISNSINNNIATNNEFASTNNEYASTNNNNDNQLDENRGIELGKGRLGTSTQDRVEVDKLVMEGSDLPNRESELTELKTNNDLLTAENEDMKKKYEILKAENEKIKAKYKISKAEVEVMRNKCQLAEAEKEDERKKYQLLKEEKDEVDTLVESLKVEKEEVDELVDTLEQRFTSFIVANQRWKKRMKFLEERLVE